MRATYIEYPEGPVLHIEMQTFDEVDCVGCGKAVHISEAEYERVELDSGGFGQQPWCKECYARCVAPTVTI
jgi:NAD-dependent SIR2 family protein deacetylase